MNSANATLERPVVVVIVEGGIVQTVATPHGPATVVIVDYDTEGADPGSGYFTVPQDDAGPTDAWVTVRTPDTVDVLDPAIAEWVSAVAAAGTAAGVLPAG